MMLYWELFRSFFTVGLFSIGGGYAAMSLIREQVVESHAWLSMQQFADLVAISEMTPGPIAINAATFVGMQVAGIGGALIATLGCILPSMIIVMLLAAAYRRFRSLEIAQGVLSGLRPAIIAMIASAGVSLALTAFFGDTPLSDAWKSPDLIAVGLFAAALVILRRWKINPIWIMAGCGGIGAVLYALAG